MGEHPVVGRLRKLELDGVTPLEALNLLAILRGEALGEDEDEE
jgi:hypothetical protein